MVKTKTETIESFGESYNSDLIDELFNEITPEEQEDTDYKMKLAAKIYTSIQQKGWTQTQLAAAMGKQVSVISKWLSGTHNFTVDTLAAIQRILGIKLIDADVRPENEPLAMC